MRFTISRWMAATAVFGLNISLVRAYVLTEKSRLDLFNSGLLMLFALQSGFLMLFALQFGLWRYLSTAGGRRRFWLGFEVCGLAATVVLLYLSDTELSDWYAGAASDLAYLCLPSRVDAILTHEHWDWFLAIIYFLPELFAATLGGLLAACLFNVTVKKVTRNITPLPESHFASLKQSGPATSIQHGPAAR
jgi:glycerol uptake facilitator-like aquaporin